MGRLFTLMFVWGPAMLGFALGWLVAHPHDWTGPAVVAPLGALVTLLSYRAGLARYRRAHADLQPYYVVGMSAGALTGVMVFIMLAFGILE
ncbi:MAG: hypothetical protein IPG17_04095 [Sandaracinaceae bacterium]|jgi:hypothetical protein|nr:hypothetical protein [Sandaracinaceae bacterium]MBP7682912.1 hypothetical protein [Deltaproteobacteria bacterium]MBK6807349.1 hypothetical protein [Sandaracinaceae bacterium]MBK7152147.1 hypothetical protein [Sandaracinaceae bacterium]MBK7778819.1 hypothetical protein [Sandaracinaceae bacterium]